MKNNKGLYVIIVVLILVAVGLGIFLKNSGETEKKAPEPTGEIAAENENKMVDCGMADNPRCFINRMNGCLPVTVKMMGSDSTTRIDLTILGVENEKCHFQRKINDVMDLDCYFPKGTFNMDTLDQTFGNDKGLQQVVDDACKPAGW